jgi:hypothetical protein
LSLSLWNCVHESEASSSPKGIKKEGGTTVTKSTWTAIGGSELKANHHPHFQSSEQNLVQLVKIRVLQNWLMKKIISGASTIRVKLTDESCELSMSFDHNHFNTGLVINPVQLP